MFLAERKEPARQVEAPKHQVIPQQPQEQSLLLGSQDSGAAEDDICKGLCKRQSATYSGCWLPLCDQGATAPFQQPCPKTWDTTDQKEA